MEQNRIATEQKDNRTGRQQNRKTTGQKDNRIIWASREHGMTYDTWHDTTELKDNKIERQQSRKGNIFHFGTENGLI